MTTDATYFAAPDLAPARRLQRAGQWDAALALLPNSPDAAMLRADIHVDRQFWRLDPRDEALAAIDAIRDALPEEAAFLLAQVEYWRRLQDPDGPELADDPALTFAALADSDRFGGWAAFWHGVSLELLHQDAKGAADSYARALAEAVERGDLLLESYAIRHQGGHAVEAGDTAHGIALLERSLDLRAALGVRPQTAAAQATLAGVLGDSPRAVQLRAIVARTADELGLVWLRK